MSASCFLLPIQIPLFKILCGVRGGDWCRFIPKKEPLHKQMPGIRLQPGECMNSLSSSINILSVQVQAPNVIRQSGRKASFLFQCLHILSTNNVLQRQRGKKSLLNIHLQHNSLLIRPRHVIINQLNVVQKPGKRRNVIMINARRRTQSQKKSTFAWRKKEELTIHLLFRKRMKTPKTETSHDLCVMAPRGKKVQRKSSKITLKNQQVFLFNMKSYNTTSKSRNKHLKREK